MSEYSQIYIRYNGTIIVAQYYPWNYGERMVSRAKSIIELFQSDYFSSCSSNFIKKLRAYTDVNFDMRDVQLSINIIDEYREHGENLYFYQYAFDHFFTNNGTLIIDVTSDDSEKASIKYAFLDNDCNINNIMDSNQYMKWCYNASLEHIFQNVLLYNDASTYLQNENYIKTYASLLNKQEVENYLKTYLFLDE